MIRQFVLNATVALACCVPLPARSKDQPRRPLSELDRLLAEVPEAKPAETSPGSLFTSESSMLELGSDLRARRTNDIVTIIVFDRASAVSRGATKTARGGSAQGSITGVAGTPPAALASRLSNLVKLGSDSKLDGQGETSRETTLNTTVTARVSRVLPNGLLLIEGSKSVRINSETQLIAVRGIVRPVDLTPDNRVVSEKIAALEISVDGKGVVGDAVRRPNFLYRALLGILPF